MPISTLQLLSAEADVPDGVREYTRRHHGFKNALMSGKFIRFVELLPADIVQVTVEDNLKVLVTSSINRPGLTLA